MSKHIGKGKVKAELKAVRSDKSFLKSAAETQHQFNVALHCHNLRVESMRCAIDLMKEDNETWNFKELEGEADKFFDYFQKDAKIMNTDKE